jgi:putative sterol carrier protein
VKSDIHTSHTRGRNATELHHTLSEARAAIEAVTPRLTALLRGVTDPTARAVGEWNIGEVAAHLSHVCAGELMSASSAGADPGPPIGNTSVEGVARFNSENLDADPERDPDALASRIEDRVGELLEATRELRGDETVTWLGGMQLPVALIFCHFLGELIVHGHDIATASRGPWTIEPNHAALGGMFLFSFLESIDPESRKSFINADAAAGLRATFELRIRGSRSWFVEFDDGAMSFSNAPARPIDCHISAEPITFLLVGFGRIGPFRPALTGRLLVWGRKPHLAFKFTRLLKSP